MTLLEKKVASLLYSILRDELPAGIMEFYVREIEGFDEEIIHSNTYLYEYSKNLVKRLKNEKE